MHAISSIWELIVRSAFEKKKEKEKNIEQVIVR